MMRHINFYTGVASLFLLSACMYKPFQPPPADFLWWEKNDNSRIDVRLAMSDASRVEVQSAMKQCGFNNLFNNSRMNDEDYATSQQCMKSRGFRYLGSFDICKGKRGENLAACK